MVDFIAYAAAGGAIALQALAGARLLGLLRLDAKLSETERMLFGQLAGFTAFSVVGMALVPMGWLNPAALGLLGLVATVVGFPEARRLTGKLRLLRSSGASLWAGLAIAALLLWLAPLWVQTALPNSDWDSALYHLPLAERHLEGLLLGRDAFFPAFAFPAAAHLHYAAFLALGLDGSIAAFNFLVALATLCAVYQLAARMGGTTAAVLAAGVLASTPLFWQLGVDPRVDGLLAHAILLAGYGLVLSFEDRSADRLPLVALALGVAIGVKSSGLFFAAPVVVCALGGWWLAERTQVEQTRANAVVLRLAVCAALLLVPNGLWYGAAAALHGDPLYPLLRGEYYLAPSSTGIDQRVMLPRQHIELEAAYGADPEISRRTAALSTTAATTAPSHLFNIVEIFLRPNLYAVKPNHGISPLLFIGILTPLLARRFSPDPATRSAALALWLVCWGSYALLGSQTNLLRYVLPVLPGAAVGAGLVLSCVRARALQGFIVLVIALLMARSFSVEWRRLELLRAETILSLPAAERFQPDHHNRWLKLIGYNFTPPMAHATEAINDMVGAGRIPASSRVLMVGEGKGRLLDIESAPDASWFGHRFVGHLLASDRDDDTLLRRLRERGYTHVLLNRAYLERWVTAETTTAKSRIAFLLVHVERFVARHGKLLFDGGGIELYELRGTRHAD